jgi:ATP-dependent DNA ligase
VAEPREPHVEASTNAEGIVRFVQEHQLEGIVAKRADSAYLPGKRTSSWVKTRITKSQEFVIGGYTPSHLGLDAIIVGSYKGKDLYFAGRIRAGFTPARRRQVHQKLSSLETARCPFVNLPQPSAARWGLGITEKEMKNMIWLLCRIRHSSHYVERRTMPHGCGRSCHHCI